MDFRTIPGVLVVLGFAGFFLFLRYLDYTVRRDHKRSLTKLASLDCGVCSAAFGMQAAQAAKIAGEKRIAEMMADAAKRGVRLRVVMLWPITCPRCGANFIFRPDIGELAAPEQPYRWNF
jgi:hypothetical protein